MATRTTIELLVNLQSGRDFVPAGRHVMEDSPYADILQAEIDAGSRHVNVLGSVEVAEETEEGGAAAPAKPGRKRTPAPIAE